MKLIALLLLLISNSSFASNVNIQPYIKKFEKMSKKKVVNVNSKVIHTLLPSQGGYFDTDTKTININPIYWKKHPQFGQEMLIFTFLGHHVLKKEIIYQTSNKYDDLCPKSIMHWALSETCYKRHREDYHKKLFKTN